MRRGCSLTCTTSLSLCLQLTQKKTNMQFKTLDSILQVGWDHVLDLLGCAGQAGHPAGVAARTCSLCAPFRALLCSL